MAPDIPQMHVINHFTGQIESGQDRNVLAESARIARGKVVDVATITSEDVDGLVIPGGYGAAKNLCDFAVKGAECTVQPDVQRLVREMVEADKPVAAICIAPAMLAKALQGRAPRLTIGNDPDTATALKAMGAEHVDCAVDGIVVDEKNRLVSTPAYMLAGDIAEAATGIEKAVKQLLAMI
jgi:enhancing lycopene biosynthesis protein 2